MTAARLILAGAACAVVAVLASVAVLLILSAMP